MGAVLIIWGKRRPPSPGGGEPVLSLRGDRFSVDVFGFPGTIHHGGGADEGFLTVGLGIQDGRFWDSARWERAAKSDDFPPNGHYLKIRWGGGKLTIENDPLGLRDIFWARWRNGFVISSRLDWVAKISGANRVNFRVIGSLWLGPSMLNWDSPVEGVFRLGPGGKVVFDGAEFVHTRPRLYQYPRGERTTPRQTLEKLAEITTAQAELVRYLSLSGYGELGKLAGKIRRKFSVEGTQIIGEDVVRRNLVRDFHDFHPLWDKEGTGHLNFPPPENG